MYVAIEFYMCTGNHCRRMCKFKSQLYKLFNARIFKSLFSVEFLSYAQSCLFPYKIFLIFQYISNEMYVADITYNQQKKIESLDKSRAIEVKVKLHV